MKSKTVTQTQKAVTKRPVHEHTSALVFLEILIWKETDKIGSSVFFFERRILINIKRMLRHFEPIFYN
jgi:hypothetical protein